MTIFLISVFFIVVVTVLLGVCYCFCDKKKGGKLSVVEGPRSPVKNRDMKVNRPLIKSERKAELRKHFSDESQDETFTKKSNLADYNFNRPTHRSQTVKNTTPNVKYI